MAISNGVLKRFPWLDGFSHRLLIPGWDGPFAQQDHPVPGSDTQAGLSVASHQATQQLAVPDIVRHGPSALATDSTASRKRGRRPRFSFQLGVSGSSALGRYPKRGRVGRKAAGTRPRALKPARMPFLSSRANPETGAATCPSRRLAPARTGPVVLLPEPRRQVSDHAFDGNKSPRFPAWGSPRNSAVTSNRPGPSMEHVPSRSKPTADIAPHTWRAKSGSAVFCAQSLAPEMGETGHPAGRSGETTGRGSTLRAGLPGPLKQSGGLSQ